MPTNTVANNKKKALLAYKQKLLEELKYYEKRIEETRSSVSKKSSFDDAESSDSEPELPDWGPSMAQLNQQQSALRTCLQATQELTSLLVLESEINVLVADPNIEREPPVKEPGLWREVTAECRIDLVPFSMTFFVHQPERRFAAPSYRGLRVTAVKAAHEAELDRSVLPTLRKPSDAVEVIRSYSAAHRSRRTTLARLADRYAGSLFMQPQTDGGYVLKCANLLEVSWSLQNKWSPVAPFHHKMKFELEYMDESYIKIITQVHRQLSDPSIDTDERTHLLSKIINTCLEAQGPTQELYESMSSDPDTAQTLRERRTTLDREIEAPEVKKKKDSEVMAPPKSLPKKAKPKGKENVEKNTKRATNDVNMPKSKKTKTNDDNINDENIFSIADNQNIASKNSLNAQTKQNVAINKKSDTNVENTDPDGNKNKDDASSNTNVKKSVDTTSKNGDRIESAKKNKNLDKNIAQNANNKKVNGVAGAKNNAERIESANIKKKDNINKQNAANIKNVETVAGKSSSNKNTDRTETAKKVKNPDINVAQNINKNKNSNVDSIEKNNAERIVSASGKKTENQNAVKAKNVGQVNDKNSAKKLVKEKSNLDKNTKVNKKLNNPINEKQLHKDKEMPEKSQKTNVASALKDTKQPGAVKSAEKIKTAKGNLNADKKAKTANVLKIKDTGNTEQNVNTVKENSSEKAKIASKSIPNPKTAKDKNIINQNKDKITPNKIANAETANEKESTVEKTVEKSKSVASLKRKSNLVDKDSLDNVAIAKKPKTTKPDNESTQNTNGADKIKKPDSNNQKNTYIIKKTIVKPKIVPGFKSRTLGKIKLSNTGNTEKQNGDKSKIPQKKLPNSENKLKKNPLRISPRKIPSKFKTSVPTAESSQQKNMQKTTGIPRLLKKPMPKI